jgi:hypothetical protein
MGSKIEFNFITLSVVVVVVIAEVVFQSIDFSPFSPRGKNALEKLIDSIVESRLRGEGEEDRANLLYSILTMRVIILLTFITWTNRSENTSLQRRQKKKNNR